MDRMCTNFLIFMLLVRVRLTYLYYSYRADSYILLQFEADLIYLCYTKKPTHFFPVNIFGFCKCLIGKVWQRLKNDGYKNHL